MMSSSRQKSCQECVRSKRRCDQEFPKCRRCLRRKLGCEYPSQSLGRLLRPVGSKVAEDGGFEDPFRELFLNETLRMPLQPGPVPTASQLSLGDTFQPLGINTAIIPSLPNDTLVHSAAIDDLMIQLGLDATGQIISETRLQWNLRFAVRHLRAVPKTFAHEAQTMFIHRSQFQLSTPLALQHALSACALYSIKNVDNQLLVFSDLERNARQLVASTDPLLNSQTDLLAALQAFLLYQIIKLFDGDIRLRAQAEADEPILTAWANQLHSRICYKFPTSPVSAEARPVPSSRSSDWEYWLVQESSRRTVMVTFMLRGVYGYLKSGSHKIPNLQMDFTAQATLWNAQSEYGWQTACSNNEHLEVRMTHWDEDIVMATPSDLEELGVLLMAMIWGVETTRRWLGKNHHAKYGLELDDTS